MKKREREQQQRLSELAMYQQMRKFYCMRNGKETGTSTQKNNNEILVAKNKVSVQELKQKLKKKRFSSKQKELDQNDS